MLKKTLSLCLLLCIANACTKATYDTEMRGVWIASVKNIDWPAAPGLSVATQKKDLKALYDFYEDMNFNSVFVQVRTAEDAFYPTEFAPWSRFVTAAEGVAPEPYYDPLEFAVEAAHQKGLDFHAWINPYRATTDYDTIVLAEDHAYYKHPDWMIPYGGKYYLNPGLPEVQEHIVGLIGEMVQNYDIDGIHFDDYFYPYKVEGEEFDDQNAYREYNPAQLEIEDWRRANVDSLVSKVSAKIKALKPWVKFGISPFGVWRNKKNDAGGSDTEALQTNYDDLYADPLSWIENEWIDYIAPQLYWSMNYEPAAYQVLARWWNKKSKKVPVYTGIAAYKINRNADSAWFEPGLIPKEIQLDRKLKNIHGEIFFSAKSLINEPHVAQLVKDNVYQQKTLPYSIKGSERGEGPQIISSTSGESELTVVLEKPEAQGARAVMVLGTVASAGSAKKEIVTKRWLSKGRTQLTFETNSEISSYYFRWVYQDQELSVPSAKIPNPHAND